MTATKAYCTQNNGDCKTCSLVNYGRDCQNNPLRGGSRPGSGRKKTLPDGAVPMAIKMTVDEREKVNEFLKQLRADKK